MQSLILFIKYFVIIFISVLLLLVVYKVVTGKISLKKLLSDKKTGNLSHGRVQQFIFTIVFSGYLIWYASKKGNFPEIDINLLLLFAASSSVYITGKIRSLNTLEKYKRFYKFLKNQLKGAANE